MGGMVLSQAIHTKAAETQELIMQAYDIGTTVGVRLPHSRGQEMEADTIGLLYMARAGYDPREAISFWHRFKKLLYTRHSS